MPNESVVCVDDGDDEGTVGAVAPAVGAACLALPAPAAAHQRAAGSDGLACGEESLVWLYTLFLELHFKNSKLSGFHVMCMS